MRGNKYFLFYCDTTFNSDVTRRKEQKRLKITNIFTTFFHFGVEHILSWKKNRTEHGALSFSQFSRFSLLLYNIAFHDTHVVRVVEATGKFSSPHSCVSHSPDAFFSLIWYVCWGLTKLIYCITFSGASITSRHWHSMMMMMKLIFSYLQMTFTRSL